MKKLNKDNKGFSLVELLVVIAIMVVLVGVLAPTLLGNIEKSRVSSDIQVLDSIAGAIQSAIGSDEKAYTEAMALAAATSNEYTVEALYTGITYNTSQTASNLASLVQEYLAKAKISFKGSDAQKAYAAKDNLKFKIDSNGTITVTLYKTGTEVLKAKNVDYQVVR